MSTPCPICGKPVQRDDPEMPFCSERCRLIDLGSWASDQYVIPGESLPEEHPSQKEDE